MEVTESTAGASQRRQGRMLVGAAFGFLAVVLIGVASADETPTSGPVEPDVESAPAVVVSAGADAITIGAVTPLVAFSDTGTEYGTGFKLDDGRIGTVAHALIDARRVGIGDALTAPLADLSGESGVPNRVDLHHDLAALILETDLGSMPMSSEPAMVGDRVALAGFGRDGRLTSVSGEVIYRGSGADYGLARPDIYVIGVPVEEGWSGGPVVNPDGEVVGVIVGLERTSGVAIAVPIEHLPVP